VREQAVTPLGTPDTGSLHSDGPSHARLRRLVDPERFDRDRDPNPHVGFGHGPRHCIGASITRIELAAALAALARRLPGLTLACHPEEVPWTGNPLDDGPASLPVTW
jgi:cytochrome P450